MVQENWIGTEGRAEKETGKRERPPLLDYKGLMQAAELIERIKRREEISTTSQPKEAEYDGGQQQEERTSEVKS